MPPQWAHLGAASGHSRPAGAGTVVAEGAAGGGLQGPGRDRDPRRATERYPPGPDTGTERDARLGVGPGRRPGPTARAGHSSLSGTLSALGPGVGSCHDQMGPRGFSQLTLAHSVRRLGTARSHNAAPQEMKFLNGPTLASLNWIGTHKGPSLPSPRAARSFSSP